MKLFGNASVDSDDQEKFNLCSLQQIILSQCDEPSQRHCIYRLDEPLSGEVQAQHEASLYTDEAIKSTTKFYQIRVKSIKFQHRQAVAIYFYEISNQIKNLWQSEQINKER